MGDASGWALPFARLRSYSPGVLSLLAGQVLMNLGFYMLFPLLTLHLTQDLGVDLAVTGFVLAMRTLIQQGSAPLGGALSDRIGYKTAIVTGFGVRVLGFLLYAVASDLTSVLVGTVVVAVAGALFDAPSRAAVAILAPERDRQSVYAAAGTANWVGQALGPLIGAALLPFSFAWVSAGAAVVFLAATFQALVYLPGGMRGDTGGLTVLGSIGVALRDRDFVWFTALLLGFFFLTVQTVASVPILTARVAGREAIGPIFAIQAGLAILLQVPLVHWTARRAGPLAQTALAMLLVSIGFFGYGLSHDFATLAVFTSVVAIGQLFVSPAQSLVTARLAGSQAGAYFGVGALALGLGGALGNASGGLLLDLGDQVALPWLPWTTMAAVALLSGIGFFFLGRDARLRSRLAPAGTGVRARTAGRLA